MTDLSQIGQNQVPLVSQLYGQTQGQAAYQTDPNYALMAQLYGQTANTAALPTAPAFENGVTKEKERIANRLANFHPKDTVVWREITQRFGSSIKQPELLSIATVLAQNANIKLDRDAKRRKSVLIKWFQENWQIIRPFLDYVVLEDSHNQ